MESRHEEVSKKAVAKDYGRQIHKEVRIEYFLNKLLELDHAAQAMIEEGYRLNNILIPGYKDIGIDGQAVFILRKINKNG